VGEFRRWVIRKIGGEIEIVEDVNIRRKLYGAMPWLKEIGTGTPDCPTIVVFRIATGRYNYHRFSRTV